jgi:hypothetical protein
MDDIHWVHEQLYQDRNWPLQKCLETVLEAIPHSTNSSKWMYDYATAAEACHRLLCIGKKKLGSKFARMTTESPTAGYPHFSSFFTLRQ